MAYKFNPFTGTLDIVGSAAAGTMAIGDPVTGGTPGSILFIDGVGDLGQDNSYFYRDPTTKKIEFEILTDSNLLELSGPWATSNVGAINLLNSNNPASVNEIGGITFQAIAGGSPNDCGAIFFQLTNATFGSLESDVVFYVRSTVTSPALSEFMRLDGSAQQLVLGSGATGATYSMRFNGVASDAILTWDDVANRLELDRAAYIEDSGVSGIPTLELNSTQDGIDTLKITGYSSGGFLTEFPIQIYNALGVKVVSIGGSGTEGATDDFGYLSLNGNTSGTGQITGDVQWVDAAIGGADKRGSTMRAYNDGAANQSTVKIFTRSGGSFIDNGVVCRYDGTVQFGTTTSAGLLTGIPRSTSQIGMVMRAFSSATTGDIYEAQWSTAAVSWKIDARGNETISPVLTTSGTPATAFTITGGAHTGATASAELIDFNANLARTVQRATGAVATQRAALFQAPTYSFVGASTITDCATVAISAEPSAGANATITNPYSLWVQAGTSYLAGRLHTGSGKRCFIRVITAAGAVTVATTDDIVIVNKTVGAATTVNLPASPVSGDTYVVKDGKGDAATNNLTITPAAGNIDGAGTYVMNVNYQSVIVSYNGTQWNVL